MSKPTPNHPKRALLSDLESIRSLLDEDAAETRVTAAGENTQEDAESGKQPTAQPDSAADERVPLLEVEDMVAGAAFSLDEAPLRERGLPDKDGGGEEGGGLDDELFEALLGDQWKSSAARILEDASASIEEVREQWLPEDTTTLNHALRVRIDDTIRYWLRGLVTRNMDDLRAHLLSAADDQLRQSIVDILSAKPQLTRAWNTDKKDNEENKDG